MSPVVWVFLGAGVLLGVGLMVYNAFFVEEEDEEEEGQEGFEGGATMVAGADVDTLGETLAGTAEDLGKARKSRMLALKDSLERSLEGREGEGAESRDRMSMPWFLLIGGPGCGKTTMLANTGLPLPYGPAFEVDSRKRDAGRWWLFDQAVVLEAPAASAAATATASTLSPTQTAVADTSEGWNTLLHMLRSERPDSPLNGIVVTVSCADLVAGGRDSEKLAEQAERIRSFLERTRRVLEVRLPLHVLVTKCDVLPGFRAFADNLPPGRRSDIFGWANPNKLEAPFNPSWVDVGCEALKKELEDLRDEILAAPDELRDADGLFVFVNEFGGLQEPLRDFVSRLYTEGEKRPPLFFRGVYFCGDAIDPALHQSVAADQLAAGNTRATMQLSAEAALTGTTAAHNLVFLKSLFTDKIFKEAGLARPVARFRLSRDRRVVVAQAAAAIIAVVGSAGLWTTVNGFRRGDSVMQRGLKADAEALSAALAGMAIDLDDLRRGGASPDAVSDRRSRDAAVVELVDDMRGLRAIRRSPFIPASWFSPLPDQVKQSMETGIQDIALPVIRQRLEERAAALLDTSMGDTTRGSSVMSNPRQLANYLSEVRTLSRQITLYNRLATSGSGGLTELTSLLDYLFGVQLDPPAGGVSDDFQNALRAARADSIVLPQAVAATVVARCMRLVSSLGEEAGRQLARPATAAAARGLKPEDDLIAFRQLGTLVELSDARRGIVASVTDATILGMNLARQVQDSIAAQVKGAAVRISGDTGAAQLQADRLRRVIDTLFAMRLMDPVETQDIIADFRPTERLRWDVGSLELALIMRQERDRAVVTVIDAMPGQSPDRLRAAFDVQLRARALGVAAGAQRLTPINPGSAMTVEVKLGAANLDAASSRLVRLARMLDTLKAEEEGRRLIAAATRQAEQVLGTAQSVLENARDLTPDPEKASAWQGVIPFSWATINVQDSLRFETARIGMETLVRDLTTDVEPALRFLGRVAPGDVRVPRLTAEWSALVANMQKYDKGDATGSVTLLRRLLSGELNVRDAESCAKSAAVPDTVKPLPDPFIRRRRLFYAVLIGRCGSGGADAVAAWQKLRTLFNTRIAGRFPFVDSAQAHASPPPADVDPIALREFLAQYDAFMAGPDVAMRSDPAIATLVQPAAQFLKAMAPVRAFLAPLMDAAEKRPPEYTVVTQPADSVTGRELAIGGVSVPLDPEEHLLTWHLGDAIRLTERDSSARARVAWSSSSSWSLLQLASQGGLRFFHSTSRAELMPPSGYPALAPDVALPAGARPSR